MKMWLENTIGAWLISLLVIGIVSCSQSTETSVPTRILDFQPICINGVQYWYAANFSGYNGYGFMAPAYTNTGELIICSNTIPTVTTPAVN